MIKKYNRKSLYWGIPGIIFQIIGIFLFIKGKGNILGLLGTALLLIGFGYYAKAKGRNWAWCFLAFLPIIGLIFLALLPDTISINPEAVVSARRTYRFWLIFYLCTSGLLGILLIIRMIYAEVKHSPCYFIAPLFLLFCVLPAFIPIGCMIKMKVLSSELEGQLKEKKS